MDLKNIEKIQNLLPVGYIFLVLFGIMKESIFYYQIGINIITYSSIMDILISPIAVLTSHPIVFIAIVLLFILFANMPSLLFKYEHTWWVQKNFPIKNNTKEELSEEERKDYYTINTVKTCAFFLLSFFLGYGLGGGHFLSEKIKGNKLEYDHILTFSDQKSETVYIIGSNTAYYFYMSKGNQNVKITPVGSIKSIELIKNKMLTNTD